MELVESMWSHRVLTRGIVSIGSILPSRSNDRRAGIRLAVSQHVQCRGSCDCSSVSPHTRVLDDGRLTTLCVCECVASAIVVLYSYLDSNEAIREC